MSKLNYLGWVLGRRLAGQSRACPFCDTAKTELSGRKRLVVELRACPSCGLKFRWPKPEPEVFRDYYQEDYFSDATTETPDGATLKNLVDTGFAGSGDNDMSHRIGILRSFRETGRVLDFGCSWGYGTWQLKQAGYDVTGFEILRSRTGFARDRLGQTVIDDPTEIASIPDNAFDIVFTSHVLEHLPDLRDPLKLFNRLLKSGGLLVAFIPNGDGGSARALGCGWDPLIDQDHVLALDAPFFIKHMESYDFAAPHFNSGPFHQPFRAFGNPDAARGQLPGDELCIVAENR